MADQSYGPDCEKYQTDSKEATKFATSGLIHSSLQGRSRLILGAGGYLHAVFVCVLLSLLLGSASPAVFTTTTRLYC